jgi:type I restriction enzyme, S subunit
VIGWKERLKINWRGWVLMFDETSLADAVEFIVDNRGKTVPVQKSGFPLIATNCVSNKNLYPEFNNVRYVSNEIYENWFRAHPLTDDILLTNKGSKNGAICLVPDPVSFCIAQDMVALRAKKNVVYPRYLFAVLRSGLVQNRIKELNVDSVIPHFKKTDFNKLFFPLPKYENQIDIGDTYFDLSKKIELNHQTNKTLEQIAQTIFKSWFVDFEPVKAKIQANLNGDDPELAAMCAISAKLPDELDQLSLETQQQLKNTAALFPDALVESDLGEIPEGWDITDLKSATTELRRGISPKYTEENGIKVVNQKCIRNHSVNFELTRLNDPLKRKVDGRLVEVGDVLVNSTGVGTLGRLAPIRYLPEPTVFDSHVTVVRADEDVISKSFLAGLMLVNESYIEASGAGSTGQTELRKEILQEIRFTKPSLELGMLFDDISEPFSKQIAELEQQLQILAQTRDALLPKLLSGEISITDSLATVEMKIC